MGVSRKEGSIMEEVKTTVVIDGDLYRKIKILAAEENKTVKEIINDALWYFAFDKKGGGE